MPSTDKPLVSFTLLGYNQEHFIREAIVGALAQTYSPLEIILSDDRSTDRTFAIMQEMAAAYSGPHKLIVRQNIRNLGLGGHVSAVMELAQGELIIRADGDDFSLPERTEVLTAAWLASGRPSGIGSRVILINEQGEMLPLECQILSPPGTDGGEISTPELIRLFLQEKPLGLLGASAAWAKANWILFGIFREETKHEDTILSFRGFMHGGLQVIDQELIKYRAHQHNLTFNFGHKAPGHLTFATCKAQALRVAQHARSRHAEFLTVRGDIATAKIKLGVFHQTLAEHETMIDRRISELAVWKEWWRLGFLGRLFHWSSAPYASWQQRIPSLFGLSGFSLIRYLFVRLRGSQMISNDN